MAGAIKSRRFCGPLVLFQCIPRPPPPLGRAHASGHDLLTPLLDAALLGDPEVGATPSHESKAFACCFGFLCFRDTVMPRLSYFCLLGGLG